MNEGALTFGGSAAFQLNGQAMQQATEKPAKPVDAAMAEFQAAGACLEQGLLRTAVGHYLAALRRQPDFCEARYNLGLAYQEMGRLDPAAEAYRSVLALKPNDPKALNNLGQVLAKTGELENAADLFYRATLAAPQFAEPHFNLGELAARQKRWDEAIRHFRRALKVRPDMVEAYNNLGNAFQQRGSLEAAEKCYRRVVALAPHLAEGFYNLGSVLQNRDRFEEAVDGLKTALRLKPHYPEALNNLALTYKNMGRLEQAADYFSQAIALKPDFAEAYWNRSFTHLLNGDFEKGWRDYEWRFKQARWKTLYPFRLDRPRWDPSDPRHRRILVHDEQGLGDTFQFVRYLPMLKADGREVVFETRKALFPLLSGFRGIDALVVRSEDGRPSARFDSYVPLLSLPHLFGTTLETIPAAVPYIFADPHKIAAWKSRVAGPGLRVGLVWAGRPAHMNDRKRSCPLSLFGLLADLPDVSFVGLQKGPAAAQAADWPVKDSCRFVNLGEDFDDFADTAAVIANLDLVISVDTSVAHLAGAMGKPVWVLLPYIPDWRWMMGREDSPWYPTMRLFRQPQAGDWASVFTRVREEVIRDPADPAVARRFLPR